MRITAISSHILIFISAIVVGWVMYGCLNQGLWDQECFEVVFYKSFKLINILLRYCCISSLNLKEGKPSDLKRCYGTSALGCIMIIHANDKGFQVAIIYNSVYLDTRIDGKEKVVNKIRVSLIFYILLATPHSLIISTLGQLEFCRDKSWNHYLYVGERFCLV